MGFAVNLLHEPSPERAAIEVVLDLDPASFTRDQVRELVRRTADFLKIDRSQVRVLSVARWKPIIGLGLPADAAERVVKAFEHGAIAWLKAMRPLEIESVRLDPRVRPIDGSRELAASIATRASGSMAWIRPLAGFVLAVVLLLGIAGALLSALFSALSGVVTWLASAGDAGDEVVAEAPADPSDTAGYRESVLLPLRSPESVTSLKFEKGDRHVVVTSDQGSIYLIALDGRQAESRRLRIPTAGEGFDHSQTAQLVHYAGGAKAASVRFDGAVRIHYPGNLPTELRSPDARLARVQWSPDGDRLLAFTTDGRVEIWSTFVRDGRFAVWNGDGELFAFTTAAADGATELTEVWEADGQRRMLSLPGRRARFSRDGSRLTTVARDGFRIWDGDGQPLATLSAGALDHRQATAFELSPDGTWLAALFRRGAKVWVSRTDGGAALSLPLEREAGSKITPANLTWSGDGRRLGVVWRNRAWLWDVGDWQRPRALPTAVEHLTWTASGSRLLTRSKDGVWLWSGDGTGSGVQLVDQALSSAAWTSDGRWLAMVKPTTGSGAAEPIALLPVAGMPEELPAAEDRKRRALPWSEFGRPRRGSPGAPMRVAFSANGLRLLSVGWARPDDRLGAEIKVWRFEASEPSAFTLPRFTRSLRGFSISADGRWVLTEDDNRGTRSVRLWQADGPLVLGAETRDLEAAAWSPDGRFVATVSTAGDVRVWSADGLTPPAPVWSGKSIRRAPGGRLLPPLWGPEGRRLLTFAAEGTMFANTVFANAISVQGQKLRFAGHRQPVTDAAWSPDGRFLLSTSLDGSTRFWNAETGRLIATIDEHRGALVAGAWSADGRRLATVDVYGVLEVWPVPSAARG